MTQQRWIMLAATGSAALMIGALAFQYIGEMPPCKLCYWQRYGHIGAIVAGVIAVFVPATLVILLGAAAVFSSAAVGLYHVGVELGQWEGPASCTSQSISGLTTEELIKQIEAAPLVRCDEIPWEMFGLSMAGWNMVIAFALTLVWLIALRKTAV
ncbi:disulfide bond formation protein B [Thalassococcus lentus]|uniref:Disulfide bond formation protein B n=1 Tax=Thalassococcus lentus TaxID=1210524 RepID=A0ABT4XR87_9RHOB|nr:disulfide bond formation protein B [Thalassococcus lentus]MDA7424469.1 disulfide bond formation protein B [Thalassococcus lentus]